MKIKFLFILLLLAGYTVSNGQSKKAFLQEAAKAYAENNYHGALVYFEEALKFDKNDASVVYKAAEAARNYNAYGFAASRYHYLVDTLKSNNYPDAFYRLGEMYQKLGSYDKALSYYNQYLSEYSNAEPLFTKNARKNIAASTKAKTLIQNVDQGVTITRLDDQINSPDADFAASDMKGKMYFSTLKYDAKSTALRYKQIAKTLLKNSADANPEIISGYMNDRDKSVANFAFNPAGTKVYYSVCEYVNGWSQSCQIYSSDVDAKGGFSNEVLLPESINAAGSSNTQPAVGKDFTGNSDVLYFVSDRQGGKGGKDIWSVNLNGGGTFGQLVNVMNVNTEADDITPFYHDGNRTLYWSTEGREGFGGFDIFSLKSGDLTPTLLAAPYNTSMNDMFYYMNEEGTKGYLTSNRSGSAYQFDSYEACCMDIYGLDIKSDIKLDVLTFLQTDGSPLNATRICLTDADTGKELECIDNPSDMNKHSFSLKPNRNYKLVATKNGFTSATETFRTSPSDKLITKSLYLAPADLRLEVFTFENPTKALLPGTTVTLTDLTDGTVKKVVITNALGNDFSFAVKPDRNYKLEATKDGYTTAIESVSTAGAKGTIKKDLYLQKAVLQDYLPISLYFDNDYPNPRSTSPNTVSQFVKLADDYILRKPDYIKNYTAPMAGVEKENAINEIESFFANDVKNGRDKFVEFLSQLEQRLAMGEKIELEVRGFASPRSKSDYNKILSERRINSIKNEMKTINGGIIKKYIDNGALKLKDVSYGDTTAKPNVVGDIKDERNSIYNINAARERRVEILKVNYK
ncbi:MAG: hypothetical protein IPN89_01705 [Saprospiraceae bacterium]|nr:hypothetical protein [Saprospiraceae bacterium]